MRAHYAWREIESVMEYLAAAEGGTTAFALPGTLPQYAPDHPVVVRHLHLDVKIDPTAETVSGRSTLVISPVVDQVTHVRLDASDLEIGKVYIQGNPDPAVYDYDGRNLVVELWEPLAMNETTSIVVQYSVERPALGLYFIKPDAASPDRPVQVWSQNQDDDARYWFPCIDDPAMKMTTSVSAAVPLEYVAISNGVVRTDKPTERYWEPEFQYWHWRQDKPHPVYLMSLLVGPFVEHVEPAQEGLPPVNWYHLPGQEEPARRAFNRTADMIRFYQDFLGCPYPWDGYGQIAVSEFVFGGMENTGLSTMTERVLPDERAALDFSANSLVAHELAHQWFGDLVTCRHWSHGWLNEGFATYLDACFREHDLGTDEFHYEMLALARGYMREASTKYSRPIVSREYNEPIDLFDRHLYHKGAWVLHMLRARLGDVPFRRALTVYLHRFRFSQTETSDLVRAMEDATGQSLWQHFDEWVFRAGHPTLKWRVSSTDVPGSLTVTVEQGNKPEDIWSIRTSLLIRTKGKDRRIPVVLNQAVQTIVIPGVSSSPNLIVLDPDYTILATMRPSLRTRQFIAMLEDAPSVARRIEAAQALGKRPAAIAIKALKEALAEQPFWGTRKEIATVLGGMGSDEAASTLLSRLPGESHPKVRRAIVEALGHFKGRDTVRSAIAAIVRDGDASYFVEAAAVRALGRLGGEEALALLDSAMERDSFNEVIRAAAVRGLGALAPDTAALDRIEARCTDMHPTLVRLAAIGTLGTIGRDYPDLRPRVLRQLGKLRVASGLRIRLTLLAALQTVGDRRGLAIIADVQDRGADGRVLRRAREAAASIRAGKDGVGMVRRELDSLRAETKALRTRVDRLK